MAWAAAVSVLLGLAAAPGYVPVDGWGRANQADFYERWFGRQLRAMDEPILSAPGSEAGFTRRFRLLVLPTFHHAYSVRVDETRGGRARVRIVRLEGRGGYGPGKVLEREDYVAGRPEIRRLHRAIADAGLVALPRDTSPSRDGDIIICTDGVRFVFELAEPGKSLFVTRHGCGMSPRLWEVVNAADALRRKVGSDLDRYR